MFYSLLLSTWKGENIRLKAAQPSSYSLDIENKARISEGREKRWEKTYTIDIDWTLNPVMSETTSHRVPFSYVSQ